MPNTHLWGDRGIRICVQNETNCKSEGFETDVQRVAGNVSTWLWNIMILFYESCPSAPPPLEELVAAVRGRSRLLRGSLKEGDSII